MQGAGRFDGLKNGDEIPGSRAYGVEGSGNLTNGYAFIHIKEDELALVFNHLGLGSRGDDGFSLC